MSALFFLCLIAVALSIPVDHYPTDDHTQLTLADLEREQTEPLIDADHFADPSDAARSKRFIFLHHKIALAKALKLGIG